MNPRDYPLPLFDDAAGPAQAPRENEVALRRGEKPFSDALLATIPAPGIALVAAFVLRSGTGEDERIGRPSKEAARVRKTARPGY